MPKTVYKFILVQAILDLHRESCRNLIKNPNQKYFPQNKRMNEYNGISATKIVQIYKHTFFKILLTG